MTRHAHVSLILAALVAGGAWGAPTPEVLADQQQLLEDLSVKPKQLMALALDTPIVVAGEPRAVICHADVPAWRQAAELVQTAVREATGADLRLVTDKQLTPAQADTTHVILLGHLDNNQLVARLYHNFFVCLDVGYTGREGYVIRSVHDPFGSGHNYILVGGSYAEGTAKGAQAFADLVAQRGRRGELTLGRLLELNFDRTGRAEAIRGPMSEADRDSAIATGRKLMFSPGQGRSGIGQLKRYGILAHRTGDPMALQIYKGLMLALLQYHSTDEYITTEGMARYDRDFRDAWTHEVAILWDLNEESGVFSDAQRLDLTNLVLCLGLECVLYQRWDRPDTYDHWLHNDNIVHNHNTFPALGVYFAGSYLKRHYVLQAVDKWLDVAHGIFNGQKHSSKPLEDAAAYQWLPVIHTMVYSLAEGDLTFFTEGHAKQAAQVAMMVTDNAGYQAAFGDHSAYKSSSAISPTLTKIAWFHKDPELLWGAQNVAVQSSHQLGQPYWADFEPRDPRGQFGVKVAYLPKPCYDYASHSPAYPTAPNLPWEQTFDKITFRDGPGREAQYMLLDGFGRGTHMHFDANAIIRYSAGGEPLLVDGEYIKNAPKYHNSLVIIRDGSAELTPAVTGLGRADDLGSTAYTRTWLTGYNGAEWTRNIVWRKGDYFLVVDDVRALQEADYTLRCCWRPWGDAVLQDGVLNVDHPPVSLSIANVDGAACRLETMKTSERMPISRLSQQVSAKLRQGDSYRFINLLHSAPTDEPRRLQVRRVGVKTAVVQHPEGNDVIALLPSVEPLGLRCDGELLLASEDLVAVSACQTLGGSQAILRADAPVSLELHPARGSGVLVAERDTSVRLLLTTGSVLSVAGKPVASDEAGVAEFGVAAGRHTLTFDELAMYGDVRAFLSEMVRRPPLVMAFAEGDPQVPEIPLTWRHEGFDPAPQALRIDSVTCDEDHSGRYGPIEKLGDGAFSSSQYSVMWPKGVTPTITAGLKQETDISAVVLREWHMNDSWAVGDRKLQISSDGFRDDVRLIDAGFTETGTQTWGSNVNTLLTAKVNQRATEVRLVVSPAREDSSVYIAELEILGTQPGARPRISAITSGDLQGDGTADELIVCGESGQAQALSADGEVLWSYEAQGAAPNLAIACGDVDGDGRDDVMLGGRDARLELLSAAGKQLWQAKIPVFRGIPGDVMTIVPADVDGDGCAEVVCGARNWQYLAYDADGSMLWSNVIYAHSATVGWADDFDGDGRPEIVGGNAYYRLNLIDDDGKRIFNADKFGPEQTAASSADVDGDGLPEILVGTDGGDLLCFDGDGKRLWITNLGDKVTRILPVDLDGDGTPLIVCAAESANITALDAKGQTVWRTPLPDGATDLVGTQVGGRKGFVVAAGSAGVMALDPAGKIIGRGALQGRAEALVVTPRNVAVTTDQGAVVAFPLIQ